MRKRVKYSDKAFEHGVHADSPKYRNMRGSVLGHSRIGADSFRVKWIGRKTIEILHRDFLEPDPVGILKKSKRIRLSFRKNDPAHNLQVAAVKWLEHTGGDAVVVGRIGIIREPEDFRFQICVGITGTPPTRTTKPE